MERCEQARKDGLEMRFETALTKYDEAVSLFARAMTAEGPWAPELARCLADRGAHAVDLKRQDLAQNSFVRALTLTPSLVLSPRIYSPQVISLFQSTKRRVKSLPTATLTVVTTPSGATLEVDGVAMGNTPSSPTLTATEHWIVVRRAGHEPVATSVIVSAGRVDKVELFLKVIETAASAPVQSSSAPIAIKNQPAVAAPAPASTPTALLIPAKPKAGHSVHPGLAWMPLGIAQFLERRYVPGGLLLAAELLLAAASTTTFALIMVDRLPNGSFNNVERNRALQIVNLTSAGVLLVTAIIGAIDGELHREAP